MQFCEFSRHQLIAKDYNPLCDPDGLDPEQLKDEYAKFLSYRGESSLDHIAAVRGILVYSKDSSWQWYWFWGCLHDEALAEVPFNRLWGRYRNQKGMLPRIEFEPGADVRAALVVLLGEVPVVPDDLVNIQTERGFYGSIAELLV